MTTTVTVQASCNEKTVVLISERSDNGVEKHYLEDGEKQNFTVYDEKEITVMEVPKE